MIRMSKQILRIYICEKWGRGDLVIHARVLKVMGRPASIHCKHCKMQIINRYLPWEGLPPCKFLLPIISLRTASLVRVHTIYGLPRCDTSSDYGL